ncbi:MAG: glycosyltransferase family 39 protein [Candidatus Omnitrophica bacterium]|nr:glycosyltransferase family 39 protein [Candidatus Omnitrophota bacterium]
MVYKFLLPWTALVSFLLFFIFIWINKIYLKNIFLKIDKKTWFSLSFLLLLAVSFRLIIPPLQHIMYIDEPWYMEAAKDMLQNFSQGNYPKSIGWPFVLTLSFLFFGINNWVAIYTAVILGSLTVINIFFLTYLITKNKIVSLFSAVIFMLMPLHIRWSATAETNVPSLFFTTLTIFFFFLYYQKQKYSLFWLAIFSSIFASLIRPENYLLIPLFFIGILIFKIRIPLKKIILALFIIMILVLPAIMQSIDFQVSTNWLEKESQGQLQGSNWSFSNLIHNSLNFGPKIFVSENMSFFIPFLSIIGLIYMLFKQKKESFFLIGWFTFFWLVYFFSWFQVIGGKDRFYLSFYPLIVIFAGYGFKLLLDLAYKINPKIQKNNSVSYLLFFLFISLSFPYALKAKNIYNLSSTGLETKIPELAKKDIPKDAIIIANWPTILKSTTQLRVVDVNIFLFDYKFQKKILKSKNLILYFKDYTCFDFSACDWCKTNCNLMEEAFKLELYQEYVYKDKKYGFYKIIR